MGEESSSSSHHSNSSRNRHLSSSHRDNRRSGINRESSSSRYRHRSSSGSSWRREEDYDRKRRKHSTDKSSSRSRARTGDLQLEESRREVFEEKYRAKQPQSLSRFIGSSSKPQPETPGPKQEKEEEDPISNDGEIFAGELAIEAAEGNRTIPEDEPPKVEEFKNPLKVSYEFGDSGSSYRMRKLKRCHTEAEDSNIAVSELANKRYPSLLDFNIAQEEDSELRKKEADTGYEIRRKPIGEFIDKKDLIRIKLTQAKLDRLAMQKENEKEEAKAQEAPISQADLNVLKADLLRAKLKRDDTAFKELEKKYDELEQKFKRQQMVESQQVPNNDGLKDMTAQELLLQEQLTSASDYDISNYKSIAKDSKYVNDLEYTEEALSKLSGVGSKSNNTFSINTNLQDVIKQKNQKHGPCIYCLANDIHINNNLAVSIGEHCYVALNSPHVNLIPEAPESLMILPITHQRNYLYVMKNSGEAEKEFRGYMNAIRDYYKSLGFDCLFYETCRGKNSHCMVKSVAIPSSLTRAMKGYFKNEIMSMSGSSARETDGKEFNDDGVGNTALLNDLTSTHKILIDTDPISNESKKSFKELIAKESDYFHVWFDSVGGYGHIIEGEGSRWPANDDLIVRRVIGGMIGKDQFEVENNGMFNGRKKFHWNFITGGTRNYKEDEIDGEGKELDETQQNLVDKVNEKWLEFDPTLKDESE